MADYVVNISGQDNLSPALNTAKQSVNSVKQAVTGMGASANGLDKIRDKFDKIQNSMMPLKRKIKEIQSAMAEMNAGRVEMDPELYNQMAQAAGQYKDAISDAAAATKVFASDTSNLDAMIQGLQGVAGAASVVTGAMNLFGVENDKVGQALLKVQSMLAIVNGLQTVSNVLNKDGVLIQKLKQIATSASTAATATDVTVTKAATVATKANMVAEIAATAKTKIATIAQTAWNVAKAIAKALLGDFTGLALVAAGAVLTYALATDTSTESIEEQNEAIDKNQEALDKYKESVNTSIGNILGKFYSLQLQWNNLKTDAERTEWIEKNQTAFDQLGLSVGDVTSAENVFAKNTNKVVASLIARAKAAAAMEEVAKAWTDYYKEISESNIENGGKMYVFEAGDGVNNSAYNEIKSEVDWMFRNGRYFADDYDKMFDGGKLTSWGAVVYNAASQNVANRRRQKAQEDANKRRDTRVNRASADYTAALKESNKLADEIPEINGINEPKKPTTPTKPTTPPKDPKGKDKDKEKPKTQLELYNDKINEAKKIQEEYDKGLKSAEAAQKEINQINHDILAQFGSTAVVYEFKVKGPEDIYKILEDQSAAIQHLFDLGLMSEAEAIEEIDKINDRVEKEVSENAPKFKLDIALPESKLQKLEDEINRRRAIFFSIDPKLDPEASAKAYEEWQNLLKELEDKEVEFKMKPKLSYGSKEAPQYFEQGSIEDKRASLTNAHSDAEQYLSDYKNGIIDRSQLDSEIKAINDKLREIGLEPIEISVTGDGIELLKTAAEKSAKLKEEQQLLKDSILEAANEFVNLGSSIANIIDNESGKKAALIATAIGQIALTFATALAKEGKMGIWNWIAAGIAGMTTMVTMISQLKSFATGGIIQGNQFHGDATLARVNAGEMILNGRQQNNLFRAINENRLGAGGVAGNVTFEISGSVIRGVLNNTNKKSSHQK